MGVMSLVSIEKGRWSDKAAGEGCGIGGCCRVSYQVFSYGRISPWPDSVSAHCGSACWSSMGCGEWSQG